LLEFKNGINLIPQALKFARTAALEDFAHGFQAKHSAAPYSSFLSLFSSNNRLSLF